MRTYLWDTFIGDTFTGEKSPFLLSDIDTTILLNYAFYILRNPRALFEDYDTYHADIDDYLETLCAALQVKQSMSTLPIGSIMAFAGETLPDGWLWCDGDVISRTTYADLFAVIGESYGVGDGSTTFELPDGRGGTMVGAGQWLGGGTDFPIGTRTGTETVSLTVEQLPEHDHEMNPAGFNEVYKVASGGALGIGGVSPVFISTIRTGNTGDGDAHNNMQPSQVIGGWIIYSGVV